MRVTWDDLGRPVEPGYVTIDGLKIWVDWKDIILWKQSPTSTFIVQEAFTNTEPDRHVLTLWEPGYFGRAPDGPM